MRISLYGRWIFFSNPKTGSTSIRHLLDKSSDKYFKKKLLNDLIKNKTHYSQHIEHIRYRELENALLKYNININKFFTFITIRNPWERVVSLYFYQKPDKNNKPHYDINYDKSSAFAYSFNEWFNTNNFGWMSLDKWAFEDNKQIITQIYKIENFSINKLNKDISDFYEKNNINKFKFYYNGRIPIKNKSNHMHYTKYYKNKEMIEKVKNEMYESKYYKYGE